MTRTSAKLRPLTEGSGAMNSERGSPCSIRIFLRDGDSDGIRSAERTMSTTQAMAFRRSQLAEAKADFGEMIQRPGVYVLLGAEDGPTDQREAYIGESEGVYGRIAYHASPKGGKAFWEDAIVLVSKDENLTKSHARYVESRLIAEAQQNPRWSLPNRQEPSGDAGRLPLADRFDMDKFVEEAKMLVGVLGCDLFRSMRVPRTRQAETRAERTDGGQDGRREFLFAGKSGEFRATMQVGSSGLFVVQAGSQARLKEVPSAPLGVKTLRETMRAAGDLREEGGVLLFSGDYGFKSVSSAAGVVCGASVNGRNSWKHADGRTYGECEASENAASGDT